MSIVVEMYFRALAVSLVVAASAGAVYALAILFSPVHALVGAIFIFPAAMTATAAIFS